MTLFWDYQFLKLLKSAAQPEKDKAKTRPYFSKLANKANYGTLFRQIPEKQADCIKTTL